MTAKKRCCFLSFDYSDFDVLLNVSAFYRLAGFSIISFEDLLECDLIVYLRGLPPQIYPEYTGSIHFYDYVLEHVMDIRSYFPNASSITTISILEEYDRTYSPLYVRGYIPVIPSLWYIPIPLLRRSQLPLHVSNYKSLASDHFQQQLIDLAKTGKIRIYGSKWDRIHISARPLSYLSANIILATSTVCFGLMYPYQRGKSLSGRMWQAPIQGCNVISEQNTNLFECPGVFSVESFYDISMIKLCNPDDLADQAAEFWLLKTKSLARDLDLILDWRQLPFEVARARFLLIRQHFQFWSDFYLKKNIFKFKCMVKSFLSLQ